MTIEAYYDFASFGRRFRCTKCGIEDFLSDRDMLTMNKIDLLHECKPILLTAARR